LTVIEKIGTLAILFAVVWIWNRYIPKVIFRKVIRFHEKNNAKNIDKQPLKFLVDHEEKMVSGVRIVYWIAAIIVGLGILVN
jgi:hypothetical protein